MIQIHCVTEGSPTVPNELPQRTHADADSSCPLSHYSNFLRLCPPTSDTAKVLKHQSWYTKPNKPICGSSAPKGFVPSPPIPKLRRVSKLPRTVNHPEGGQRANLGWQYARNGGRLGRLAEGKPSLGVHVEQ